MPLLAQLSMPQIVLIPTKRRNANSLSVHCYCCVEHGVQDGSLGGVVANLAEGQSKWVRHEQGA